MKKLIRNQLVKEQYGLFKQEAKHSILLKQQQVSLGYQSTALTSSVADMKFQFNFPTFFLLDYIFKKFKNFSRQHVKKQCWSSENNNLQRYNPKKGYHNINIEFLCLKIKENFFGTRSFCIHVYTTLMKHPIYTFCNLECNRYFQTIAHVLHVSDLPRSFVL